MFPNIPLLYIFGPALLIVIILGKIAKGREKPSSDPIEKSISNLKFIVVQLGCLLVLLYICLPSTPSLSTFGYPDDINSINLDEKVLRYLQKYNHAIVRTAEVLHWTLFLVAWWLLSSVFALIKAFKNHQPKFSN